MESFKAWHIMREGIIKMIKDKFPNISNKDLKKIVNEIEEECEGQSFEEVAGCAYRKLEEIELGET